jgi:hypothetical protein
MRTFSRRWCVMEWPKSPFEEFTMKSPLKVALTVSALLGLSACGGGYVSAGVGGPVYYDGYYDGYYGPLHDGYWGDDNFFYYSGGRGRPFVRDEGGHFRRDAAGGYNAFHQAHAGPHTNHPHEPAHG